jgi:hypothetical protein
MLRSAVQYGARYHILDLALEPVALLDLVHGLSYCIPFAVGFCKQALFCGLNVAQCPPTAGEKARFMALKSSNDRIVHQMIVQSIVLL